MKAVNHIDQNEHEIWNPSKRAVLFSEHFKIDYCVMCTLYISDYFWSASCVLIYAKIGKASGDLKDFFPSNFDLMLTFIMIP